MNLGEKRSAELSAASDSPLRPSLSSLGLLRVLWLFGLTAVVNASKGPSASSDLVYTQLSQVVDVGPSSHPINQRCRSGNATGNKQYSIWGWFKYTGTAQVNSNILILRRALASSTTQQSPPKHNPQYPSCPYDEDDFANNPSLMSLSSVSGNPNCQAMLQASLSTEQGTQDLLYVNFNYYPVTANSKAAFDLLFMIQNGVSGGVSTMLGNGFTGQSMTQGAWLYFAVSLDYAKNVGAMYYQVFDSQMAPGTTKTITPNFAGFQMGPDLLLSIVALKPNAYMTSIDPFVGQIGCIQLGLFYTSKLALLWMGFNPSSPRSLPTPPEPTGPSKPSKPTPPTVPTPPASVRSICMDLIFNAVLMTITDSVSNSQYKFQGYCSPYSAGAGTLIGMNFFSNSSVVFYDFERSTRNQAVQSLTFFLQFSFQEPLPSNFILLQKGTLGISSYLSISLIAKPGVVGRFLAVSANNKLDQVNWVSQKSYAANTTHALVIGLTTDLANGLYIVYMDAATSLFPQIKCSFPFDLSIDTGSNLLFLFNNQVSGPYTGYVTLSRFVLLNSASIAVYNALLSPVQPSAPSPSKPASLVQNTQNTQNLQNNNATLVNQSINVVINNYNYNQTNGAFLYGGYDDFGKDWDDDGTNCFRYNDKKIYNPNNCLLGSSYYSGSNYCLMCPGGQVATMDGCCVAVCPTGYSTFGGHTCLPCTDPKCSCPPSVIPNTTNRTNITIIHINWTVIEVTNVCFRLVPSLPILNSQMNPYHFIPVNISGLPPNTGYSHSIDVKNQWVNFCVNASDRAYCNMNVSMFVNLTNVTKIISLANHTKINITRMSIVNFYNDTYSTNGTWNRTIFQICNLSGGDVTSYNALAITLLVLFAVAAFVLLCLTLCCWKRVVDLGGLWKFFLYQWVKLTFVAFLIVLGIHLPCCLRQFLHILYMIGVRWDQAFAEIINSVYNGSSVYWAGIASSTPPMNFRNVGVFAFVLHNMMIAFIIQLFIFTIWILVMIWDCLITSRGRCMYYTYVFMQFTVLIVGYVFFCMHAWVFSALNIRSTPWTHAYFIICFFIAVMYIVVFVAFWLYSAFRLCGSSAYFLDEVKYANFYYFFAGFRDTKLARVFDLIFLAVFFVIGLVIGFLWDVPIAQTVLILIALVLLFFATLLIRPWRYWLLTILELVSVLLLAIVAAMLVALAAYGNDICLNCGNREFSTCYALVALLFVALLLPILGLIFQALCQAFCPQRAESWAYKQRIHTTDEAFYGYAFGQQHIQHVVTTTNVVAEQNIPVYGLKRDVQAMAMEEAVSERLLTGQDMYCASCRFSIDTCPIHGRGAQISHVAHVTQECQGMDNFDAKRSMLDFMNELREKRMATNTRVREIETTQQVGAVEGGCIKTETRVRTHSQNRRTPRVSEDVPDDGVRQSRILNILDEGEDEAGFARRGSATFVSSQQANRSYNVGSLNQTRNEEYTTTRVNRTTNWAAEQKKNEDWRYK